MTKTTCEQTAQTDDPLDQADFELNADETRRLCEVLANPPAADTGLRELMTQIPPWETENP